jgi:outer membrane lipoprotein-sorting protein
MAVIVLAAVALAGAAAFADELTAQEVLDRTRAAWQGESFHGLASLDVTQNAQTSSYRFEVWTQGEDDALMRILEPQDQAGSGYLMTADELWYYSPEVGASVKLPSIALGSSVFGAGPALDDVFRSTLSEDYEVTMTAEPSRYLLTLVPRPDTPVVYGRLEIEVTADFVMRTIVYYDQRGDVLQTATFSDDVTLADRILPTTITVVEADGDTTVERVIDPEFDVDLDPSVFTLDFLENP